MTPEQIAALCEAAKKRLQEFINRSAAQHLRAMQSRVNTDGNLFAKREN